MGIDNNVLQAAISEVNQELSCLSAEQSAFEEFRKVVRLTAPDPNQNDMQSETTRELRETYRSEVMDELEYEATYGDTLVESLTHELSPALANVLDAEEPITARRRRQLLVATAETIEGRKAFCEVLQNERSSLESYAAQLSEIESTVNEQPVCSVQNQTMETVLRVWEQYESLKHRCEELVAKRQRQLKVRNDGSLYMKEWHTLNEYLYHDLESSYPVLSAVAEICERIKSRQKGHRIQCRPVDYNEQGEYPRL